MWSPDQDLRITYAARTHLLAALIGFGGWILWSWLVALMIAAGEGAHDDKLQAFAQMIRSVPLALAIGWGPALGIAIGRRTGVLRLNASIELEMARTANIAALGAGAVSVLLLLIL